MISVRTFHPAGFPLPQQSRDCQAKRASDLHRHRCCGPIHDGLSAAISPTRIVCFAGPGRVRICMSANQRCQLISIHKYDRVSEGHAGGRGCPVCFWVISVFFRNSAECTESSAVAGFCFWCGLWRSPYSCAATTFGQLRTTRPCQSTIFLTGSRRPVWLRQASRMNGRRTTAACPLARL